MMRAGICEIAPQIKTSTERPFSIPAKREGISGISVSLLLLTISPFSTSTIKSSWAESKTGDIMSPQAVSAILIQLLPPCPFLYLTTNFQPSAVNY
jgi:hypothetical protein